MSHTVDPTKIQWGSDVRAASEQHRRRIDGFKSHTSASESKKYLMPADLRCSHTQAIGKPFTLWTAFGRFYERHNSLDSARLIFEKASAVPFKYVDDLASVWCEYAEMELRHQNYRNALQLLRTATAAPTTFNREQVLSSLPCKSGRTCSNLDFCPERGLLSKVVPQNEQQPRQEHLQGMH